MGSTVQCESHNILEHFRQSFIQFQHELRLKMGTAGMYCRLWIRKPSGQQGGIYSIERFIVSKRDTLVGPGSEI